MQIDLPRYRLPAQWQSSPCRLTLGGRAEKTSRQADSKKGTLKGAKRSMVSSSSKLTNHTGGAFFPGETLEVPLVTFLLRSILFLCPLETWRSLGDEEFLPDINQGLGAEE